MISEAGLVEARPGSSAVRTAVDVCVCTFQRPMLAECLRAILAQAADADLRLIVADNAETPEARARVAEIARQTSVPVIYLHAPARNIAIARNACLDAAQAEWIAFLDDDETAAPGWLAALLAEARSGGWDAVLGPVEAIYPQGAPAWMKAGRFHSTGPVWVGGEIRTGYTGNVLIRRATVERLGLRFRPEFGRTGGEDLDFFYRFRDGGGRIGFAPDAVAAEPVPEARARLSWLIRRRFRAGQSHGSRLLAQGARPLVQAPVAAAKAGICALGAAASALAAERRNRFLTRAALHAGVVARLCGWREIESY